MLYSLPTGKVIEMSIDQFLEISDEELEYLISINYGESIENPFFGSILERPAPVESTAKIKVVPIEPLIEEIDTSIDFTPEEE
jgi:hypothetical protein